MYDMCRYMMDSMDGSCGVHDDGEYIYDDMIHVHDDSSVYSMMYIYDIYGVYDTTHINSVIVSMMSGMIYNDIYINNMIHIYDSVHVQGDLIQKVESDTFDDIHDRYDSILHDEVSVDDSMIIDMIQDIQRVDDDIESIYGMYCICIEDIPTDIHHIDMYIRSIQHDIDSI